MTLSVKYGLITGLGVCGWMLLEFALGFHTTRLAVGEYSSYFSTLIPFGMLFHMLRARQQGSPDGQLLLLPSVRAGLTTSLVAGLVVCTFMLLYNQVLNPGWIDAALEWKVGQWRTQDMSEAAIREQILVFRHLNSPRGLLLSIGAGMPVMGAIFSYGITLFLRRNSYRH